MLVYMCFQTSPGNILNMYIWNTDTDCNVSRAGEYTSFLNVSEFIYEELREIWERKDLEIFSYISKETSEVSCTVGEILSFRGFGRWKVGKFLSLYTA
jgi:hypothetical protein